MERTGHKDVRRMLVASLHKYSQGCVCIHLWTSAFQRSDPHRSTSQGSQKNQRGDTNSHQLSLHRSVRFCKSFLHFRWEETYNPRCAAVSQAFADLPASQLPGGQLSDRCLGEKFYSMLGCIDSLRHWGKMFAYFFVNCTYLLFLSELQLPYPKKKKKRMEQ